MALVIVGSDSRSHQKIESTLLLDAGRDGNEELARVLLDGGEADIRETNEDGQTALHLAVLNSHESMIDLLIGKGADIEASTKDGSKPLYIAAKSGNLSLVEVLLFFNAQVESFNVRTQTTAFYQAIENDHETVAKTLLEHGADIDFRVPNGSTALCRAVVLGKLDHVKFLLRQGANKKLLEEEGIIERLSNRDDTDQEMLKILQKAQLVQGPSLNSSKKAPESRFTHVPSLPATEDQANRLNACRGFEATIVDFFVGDREERVQVSASVFDILYGIGPEATMGMAKDPKILGTRPNFRWYHLPANNMAWVEALVSRLVAERKSGAAMLGDDLKSSLGLSNASGRQYRASTTHSSFMRPLCRAVKSGPDCSFGDSTADHVMLFIPFLHFEAHDAYEEMFSIISEVNYSRGKGRDFPPASMGKAKRLRKSRLSQFEEGYMPVGHHLERKKPIRFKDAVGRKFTFPFELVATWAGMERLIRQSFANVDIIGPHVFEGHYDLVGPNGEIILPLVWETVIEPGWSISMHMWPMPKPGPPPPGPPPGHHFAGTGSRHAHAKMQPPPQPNRPSGAPPPPPPGGPPGGPPIIIMEPSQPGGSSRRKTEPQKGGLLKWMAGSAKPSRKGPEKAEPHPPPHADHPPRGPPPPPPGPPFPFGTHPPPQPQSQSQSQPQRSSLPTERPSEAPLLTAGGALFDPSNMSKSETKPAKADHTSPVHTSIGTESKVSPENGPNSKGKQPDRTAIQPPDPSEHKSKSRNNLDKDLIMGYLFPTNPGEMPPLQPRRTLDQYFYTHLESTSQRDADQVVYRYTMGTSEAKIFMVDQLWLWILNEDIVISCFPQRWQSELQNKLHPEEEAHDTKFDEPPSVSKQDHLLGKRPAGVPESSGLRATSGLQMPSPVPGSQMHRSGAPPSPTSGWPGMSGGHPTIVNLPQEKRKKKKKKKQSGILEWMGGKSVPSSGEKSDVLEWVNDTAGPSVKDSHQESEGGDPPLKAEPPPATTKDSLSSEISLPASPPLAFPPPSPSLPPVHEIPSQFQDNTLTYAAEQAKQASREDTRSIKSKGSSNRKPKASRAIRDDPLDVHQTILRYLKGSARAPITTIYDLANLITNSCANVFDQYSVPDAFQFLDFFERSIGTIIDQESQCLQEFTDSLNAESVILDIKKETAMLVEIKDISDELDILQIVLDDQKKTMEDMAQVTQELTRDTIATMTSTDENLSLKHNRVLESHIYRIQKMKKMTENSYKGLQHLLDLKQKQANLSEALSARKQAENTFHQADLARQQGERSLRQAQLAAEQARLTAEQTRLTTEQVQELNKQTKLAREQADETVRQGKETARQGKTILMFTVVTIIFLPLSFMAAFFAINLEAFPVNENGKLPIPFVLKYMLSISGALSIPFVVVAFQQERISNWLKNVPWTPVLIWFGAVAVVIVPIVLIWTRPLASGVKIALTIALVFITAIGIFGFVLHKLITASRDTESTSSSYYTDDRSTVDD